MSVCKQTPKKNVQLVNCPSENTATIQQLFSEVEVPASGGSKTGHAKRNGNSQY